MRYSKHWVEFELIDAGDGEKLERWGKKLLIRPDPQAIWKKNPRVAQWATADYIYQRSSKGGGHWTDKKGDIVVDKNLPNWLLSYKNFKFQLKLTQFKHTALFPEQAVNWDKIADLQSAKMLNLFAYTGGATVAGLSAGAEVVHVDASGGMIGIAQNNVTLSNLDISKVRFIKDDVIKFIDREIRRGIKYDSIVMDPPAYGRGSSGELWEIEHSLAGLLQKCRLILSDAPKFILINLYANEFSITSFANLAKQVFGDMNVVVEAEEIGLPITSSEMILPCGYSIWVRFNI